MAGLLYCPYLHQCAIFALSGNDMLQPLKRDYKILKSIGALILPSEIAFAMLLADKKASGTFDQLGELGQSRKRPQNSSSVFRREFD